MALNFQQLGMLAKLKSAFSTFQQEHPKFMPFIHAVKGDACRKDSIIEISVKSPEGRNYTTNFRVTEKGFGTYPDAERYAGKTNKVKKSR